MPKKGPTKGAGPTLTARGFKPWTPFTPALPPAGSYDPAFDAQKLAIGRGLSDTAADVATAAERGTVDYGLAKNALLTAHDRASGDIATRRGYAGEDHSRALAMLGRAYSNLQARQEDAARASGVSEGGWALQSAQKRAANQAIDQQPIDQGFARETAALDQSGQRLEQDYGTQLGQLALNSAPPDESNPVGGRSFQDLLTRLTRTGREATLGGLDLEKSKVFQATGSGWVPPLQPANEFAGPQGPYRVLRRGRFTVGVNPAGHEIWRRPH